MCGLLPSAVQHVVVFVFTWRTFETSELMKNSPRKGVKRSSGIASLELGADWTTVPEAREEACGRVKHGEKRVFAYERKEMCGVFKDRREREG